MSISSDLKAPQSFHPHVVVRSARAQTFLAHFQPRRVSQIRQREWPIVLDAGPDFTGYDSDYPVRLVGYYTPRVPCTASKGLVVSMHGWEGCSHSPYNMVLTDGLTSAGYDVFRLNLRDHGPGIHVDAHALNRGVFLGTLIDETATAVRRVAQMANGKPLYLLGASLGGNFALRLALRHAVEPFPNLKRVVTISPAINPSRASDHIDVHAEFHAYFRRRWLKSLLAKQHFFPETFDFSPIVKIASIREMTEWLVNAYTSYKSADEYFGLYTLGGNAFEHLNVPTTIITAANDLVIDASDFYALAPHPLLDVQIHKTGGHVGFIDILPFRHCLPGMVLDVLQKS